ncbi:MAG: hypothetical protein Kow0062_27780 [Acidobacteriota bacterium]
MSAAGESGTDPRRLRLLVGLLVVLALVALWTNRGLLLPGGGAGTAIGDDVAGLDARLKMLSSLPELPIDRPAVESAFLGKRNLFDFTSSPEALAAEAARRRQQEQLAQQRQQQLAQAAERRREELSRRQADATPRKPPPPEFRYRYLAYFRKMSNDGEFIAVLQKQGSRGPEQVIVGVGETIEDRFVVRDINEDEIVIGYTDPRYEDQTKAVRIVESATSSPSRRRRR